MRERVSKNDVLWLSMSKGFKVGNSTKSSIRLDMGWKQSILISADGAEFFDFEKDVHLVYNSQIKKYLTENF